MKKIMCRCPSCGKRLIEVTGSCSGVFIVCSECGASVKVDIENNGKIRLSLEPVTYPKGGEVA
ncbi:MAG: hypothetical protein J1F36_04855 [Clostridiales bacterium]|nr:hypothetical protein [Clostridiales bacterium]